MLKEILYSQISFQISKTEANRANTAHPTERFTLRYANKQFPALTRHHSIAFTVKPIANEVLTTEHRIERNECFSINKVYVKFKKVKLTNIKRNAVYAIETTNSFEINIKYDDNSNISCNSTCNTFSNLFFKSKPLMKGKCEYCCTHELDAGKMESKYEKIKSDLNELYPYIKHNDITRELIFRKCSEGVEHKYLFIKNLYNSLSVKQHNHTSPAAAAHAKSTKITIRSRSKGTVNEYDNNIKRTFNTIYK